MERMKIYLDTNTVMDFFINAAKSLKEKKEIKLPKKYQFFASQKEYVKFITSVLTKAEIVRELVAAYNMKKEDIEPVWKEFVNALNCYLIEEFKIDMKLIDVVYLLPMRLRTMVNFQHLFIAMKEDAYLLSGDKDLVRIVRLLRIYDKVLTYPELRKLLSKVS